MSENIEEILLFGAEIGFVFMFFAGVAALAMAVGFP